jgi:hypothetical protein
MKKCLRGRFIALVASTCRARTPAAARATRTRGVIFR